ncbi:hypothetical protein LHYA1_G008542 [Lachnellula hyalina]|uniref:Uncharacterized protein n=1 Tax=Lachnellula hyalina TaxID=1316788 RepID=A0A8H8TUX0_9HELO|nr:uncharacterized protein LHYA1_G008542 [Lachnellula hyalina]TVY23274.1 hypothetical protein LHYA1_G008542 [Lachnellula hyalina]
MFYQHSNCSTTLPRGFRYHEGQPTTPEPTTANELEQPSPPRPTRLKVKRRNVSSLQAPTEQFLASVAAADLPLPTIELPVNISEDSDMPDRKEEVMETSGLLAPQTYNRFSSPPKTPVPSFPMDEGPRRPDWSMGASSPDDYFTRPTSSLSNASDYSDDSFYSGSRISRPSDDGSCTSPDSDTDDPFRFPSISKGKGKAIYLEEPAPFARLNEKLRSKTRNDAPWTKAMSEHLWSTYMLYLQDPTVTPFRIGASAIPPEGVCHRVAREARRSWKGPKPATPALRRSARLGSMPSLASEKSGSLTPTENPKVYAQWPHSSSATRNHLRELCKSKNTSLVQRHLHLQSRSPTPFTHAKPIERSRLRTPEPQLSSFNTKDIALSLTTSTSKSMQPDGPLALLASEGSPSTMTPDSSLPTADFMPKGFGKSRGLTVGRSEHENNGRRLASPFLARTYGPSSSQSPSTSRPSPTRTQSDNAGPPQLRSPLRFDQPRSLTGTQKRRAQHALEEELSPNGAVLRPSILDEQLFGTLLGHQRRVRSRGFSLGDEALRAPGIFQHLPPSNVELSISRPRTNPKLLPSATFEPPPRLGSPFSESGPSMTFPRRLFQDGYSTIKRSAFATMHQTRHSIESFDFGEGPSLQSRLEQLDVKLKEIREREAAARRRGAE